MMYYIAIGVIAYVLGWAMGYQACYGAIIRQLDRMKARRQQEEIKNLYPDQ
jgi:hypothetical protein